MSLRDRIRSSPELERWLKYYAYHFTNVKSLDIDSILAFLRKHGLSDSDILDKITQNYDLCKMKYAYR